MIPLTLTMKVRSWLAGKAFLLAGKLDAAYDVWLDDAPRRDEATQAENLPEKMPLGFSCTCGWPDEGGCQGGGFPCPANPDGAP